MKQEAILQLKICIPQQIVFLQGLVAIRRLCYTGNVNRHLRFILFFASVCVSSSFFATALPVSAREEEPSLLQVKRVDSPSSSKRSSPTSSTMGSKQIGTSALTVQLRIGVREPKRVLRLLQAQPSEGWRLPSSTTFPWMLRCNKKCTTYKILKVFPTTLPPNGVSPQGTLTLQLQEIRADKSEISLPEVAVSLPDGTLQTLPKVPNKSIDVPPLPLPPAEAPPSLAVGTRKLTPRLTFESKLPWLGSTRKLSHPPNPGEPGGPTWVCSVNDNGWLPILVYPSEASAQQTISCTYYGKESIELKAITLSGVQANAFTLQSPQKMPFRLLPKQSYEFGVTLTLPPKQSPKTLYHAHLTIQTTNTPYTIHLLGTQTPEDVLILRDRFWAYTSLDEVQIHPGSHIPLHFSPQTEKEQRIVLYVAGSPSQLNQPLHVTLQDSYDSRFLSPHPYREWAWNDADTSYPDTFGEVKKLVFLAEAPTLEQGDQAWTYSLVFQNKTKISLGVKRELSTDERRQREFQTFYQVFTEAQVGMGGATPGTITRGQPESAPLFPADSILRQGASLGMGMMGVGARLYLGGTHHAAVFTLGVRLRYMGPSPHTLVQSLELGVPPEYCHFGALIARSVCIGPKLSVGMSQTLGDRESLGIVTNSPVNLIMGVSLPLRIQLLPRLHLVIEPTWNITWYHSAASYPVNRWEEILRHGWMVPVGLQYVPKFW